GGEVANGNIFVTLVDRNKRDLSQQQIVDILRDHFQTGQGKVKDSKPSSGKGRKKGGGGNKDGLRIQIIDLSGSAFSNKRGTTVELSLRGSDYAILKAKSEEIMKRMEETGEFTDLDTDYREGSKEYHIIPDRAQATRSNVTVQAIGDTMNAGIGGIRVGQYTNGDRRYDFRIRLLPEQCQNTEDIQKLMVRTNYGELIPLSSVTHTEMVSTVSSVTRENRQRAITLFANNESKTSAEKALQEALKITREILPEGYTVELTGASQTNRETFAGIQYIVLMGFLVAYMVLAAQFNSFIHPVTVLIALPFTFSGAFLALFLTNHSLNLYSGIGIILLMGISKKNSILLVEFFNKLRDEHGHTVKDAIIEGGPVRLRAILMTSVATIAAALPAAIGLGPGAEVRIPLAVTLIGGVIVSTLFTLLVVPCFYSLFSPKNSK
ncbi:MAG: efflux RND transporter permease subunit, partial [Verrucomicrobiota bacterium]